MMLPFKNVKMALNPFCDKSLQNLVLIFHFSLPEAKLQRLKGKTSTGQQTNRTLTSRDILRTLDEARHDTARHLISSDYMHDFGDDVYSAADTQVTALKRRMFPEQALSPEELQELIRKDFLQEATKEAAEEATEEETSGSR